MNEGREDTQIATYVSSDTQYAKKNRRACQSSDIPPIQFSTFSFRNSNSIYTCCSSPKTALTAGRS